MEVEQTGLKWQMCGAVDEKRGEIVRNLLSSCKLPGDDMTTPNFDTITKIFPRLSLHDLDRVLNLLQHRAGAQIGPYINT